MRLASLILAALLVAQPVRAQDGMLVLDASNSMWGRVDGRPKIAVARDAVGSLARALPAGTRMGLMAYGHRRAGDCADIEILVPPGPVDPAAFARAAAVTPRGRTPIADSIAAAVRVAPRIILVSDGIETCVADACVAVRALKSRNSAMQVHVVGFDVTDARDQQQLRCIAEATGGRFVPAASAAELGRALAEVTATAPPAPPAAAPAPAAAPVAETNLTLEAAEVEGGPSVPANWTLVALGAAPRPVLSNSGAPRPNLRVPPGRYEVQVRAGNARIAERFETQGAQMTHRVVLNLGTLRPTGALSAAGPSRGGNWTVWADEVPGFRAGEQVLTSGAATPELRLVQGSYRIRFQAGEASAQAEVFVAAGRHTDARLVLDAAEVTLVATRGGSAVTAQAWEIRRPGQPRPLATSGAARGRFVLPEGEWQVRVRVDGTWHEAPLRLAAGQVAEVPITLP
jgi:Ca-activated chloride channel family protein